MRGAAQAIGRMPPRPLLALLRRPGGWGRAWLGLVLTLAIALKLLVPQGWMPIAGGLMLCPDQAPAAPVPPPKPMMHGGGHGAAAAHAPAAHAMHGAADETPDHAMPDAERCAFAGLGLASLASVPLPMLGTPVMPPVVSPPAVFAVAIGRGLAAPPPPSTGPPAFA